MTARARVRLLNGEFDALDREGTVARVRDMLRSGERGWLSTVNVAILMSMRSDPDLQRFADRAALTVADGQPLIWAARLLGKPLPERVAGVDLVDDFCALAEREQHGVFILGGRPEVNAAMAARQQQRYPGLDLRGHRDGYYEDPAEVAKSVAASGARILLVGMGVPQQERFIEDHWDALGVDFAIGVGGSFDVLTGNLKRAPEWMQKLSLEWLYRLMQEPGRLWKRYLVTNTQFLLLFARRVVAGPEKR